MSELSYIDQKFFDLTKNFDLEDWRTVRTENYWYKNNRPRSTYEKLELLEHYVNKGVPKDEAKT